MRRTCRANNHEICFPNQSPEQFQDKVVTAFKRLQPSVRLIRCVKAPCPRNIRIMAELKSSDMQNMTVSNLFLRPVQPFVTGRGGTCSPGVSTVTHFQNRGPSISLLAPICSANYYPSLHHTDGRCCSMGLNATLLDKGRGPGPFLGVQSSVR